MRNRTNHSRYRSTYHGSRRRRRRGFPITLFLLVVLFVVAMAIVIGAMLHRRTDDSATQPSPTPTVSPTPTPSPTPEPVVYDYTQPVPESPQVDLSYFEDAVFIGDSRTQGLILYTGLTQAISYTYKGLTVESAFSKAVIPMGEETLSVMDALRRTEFSKVYLMLGVNELGWPYPDVFADQYRKVVTTIKEINPQAQIYIQEIIPVTPQVSQSHPYVTNEKIAIFNEKIRQIAQEEQVYYLQLSQVLAGADGTLPPEAATDGIHLTPAYCNIWLSYLQTHTVAQ